MYFSKIKIENFKAISTLVEINFSIPSENSSGLNIFVGENNTGKSTVFEAINFLKKGIPTGKKISDIKNKTSSDDEYINVEAEFIGDISSVITDTKFQKYIEKIDNYERIKILRTSEEKEIEQSGKSVKINIKTIGVWNPESEQFENPSGFSTAFTKFFDIDFIWADTSPDDIAKYGSTTICGKLISKISKEFEGSRSYKDFQKAHNKAFNDDTTGLKSRLISISGKTEKIFSEQFGDANIHFHFEELSIASFFKNTKININDGIETSLDEKGSGMQRAVALALLQVYSDMISESGNQPFFLFIDEPEICLHPLAQIKLLKALYKISQKQQIFITTHSPYMFRDFSLAQNGLSIFKKNTNGEILVKKPDELILPNISWGEINYLAYNLPTIEFHNELYGHLQEISEKYTENQIENFLQNDCEIIKDKLWIKEYRGEKQNPYKITLPSYIRNNIHHPENIHNDDFSEDELNDSIILLIKVILEVKKSL